MVCFSDGSADLESWLWKGRLRLVCHDVDYDDENG